MEISQHILSSQVDVFSALERRFGTTQPETGAYALMLSGQLALSPLGQAF